VLAGLAGQVVEIDAVVVLADAVADDVKVFAGEVEAHAVGEVAAVGEVEAEDGVAGLEGGEEDGHVGLGAGVRLDVGVFGAEQFLDAVNGHALGHVHEFAAAIVALAGIPLGVLVGEARTLGSHHGRARVILAGDHLEAVLLAAPLAGNRREYLGIGAFQNAHRNSAKLVGRWVVSRVGTQAGEFGFRRRGPPLGRNASLLGHGLLSLGGDPSLVGRRLFALGGDPSLVGRRLFSLGSDPS